MVRIKFLFFELAYPISFQQEQSEHLVQIDAVQASTEKSNWMKASVINGSRYLIQKQKAPEENSQCLESRNYINVR
jgi:hypothetical protein